MQHQNLFLIDLRQVKMLEKLDNSLQAILFYNEDFDKVPFIACQRHYCCRS